MGSLCSHAIFLWSSELRCEPVSLKTVKTCSHDSFLAGYAGCPTTCWISVECAQISASVLAFKCWPRCASAAATDIERFVKLSKLFQERKSKSKYWISIFDLKDTLMGGCNWLKADYIQRYLHFEFGSPFLISSTVNMLIMYSAEDRNQI